MEKEKTKVTKIMMMKALSSLKTTTLRKMAKKAQSKLKTTKLKVTTTRKTQS